MAKKKKKSFMTVLDIGTSKVCCLIVKFGSDERPEVIGMGYAPAQGIKAGAIVDLDKATDCIGAVLAQAEKQAERQIESVVVNISSTQLKSHHIQKEIEISDGKPITAADVKRLVDGVVGTCMSEGNEVIHSFPLSYSVDKEQGIADPRGLYGLKLGVHMHIITLPESQSRNLVAVLDRCHVSVEMKVATPYAAALAVLTDEEKEIGVTSIDFGAGTTSVAIFLSGGLVHLGLVPSGGNVMTRDIAQGLSTSLAVAERLKTLNGAAFLSPKDELERLIVPVLGEEEGSNIQIPRSDLISIIVPRLEEILEQTGKILDEHPHFLIATKRLVLSGGGAGLQGLKEKATASLSGTVRLGRVVPVKGLSNQFDFYTFSTCIGLLKYAMIRQKSLLNEQFAPKPAKQGVFGKVTQWLAQNF